MREYDKEKKYYMNYPIIKDKWEFLFESLSDIELEELVGLYLQVEKNYGIYTSTNKKYTKSYEFVLFNKENGERAYLQVKEHDINIESLYKLGSLGKVYIFSNNDTEYNDKRVIRITKKDLMKFIRKKIYIMPDKIKILFGENM